MSITAYVGLPGHGKSYGVVDNVISKALKNGVEVWTNIPCNLDECDKQFGCHPVQFSIDDIIEDDDWFQSVFTAGAVIVIDEVWRLWPSGLKASQVKDQHKSFLAEHRHMVGSNGRSTEVVFVTQDLSQIANFSRQLVETTFRVKKAMSLGLNKQYRVDVFFGSVTGSSPPLSKREREVHGTFKKDVFRLYQSHTLGTGEVGDETRTDGRFNILKGYGLKIGLVSFIALSYFVIKGFGVVKANYFPDQPATSQTASANALVPSDPSFPSEIEPSSRLLNFTQLQTPKSFEAGMSDQNDDLFPIFAVFFRK